MGDPEEVKMPAEQTTSSIEDSNKKSKVKIIKKRVKSHGLNKPLHPQQIIAMFIFVIDCLLFLFIIAPGTSSGIHWTWSAINTIAYLLLSIGVALVCLKATITDPTDQNVLFE